MLTIYIYNSRYKVVNNSFNTTVKLNLTLPSAAFHVFDVTFYIFSSHLSLNY